MFLDFHPKQLNKEESKFGVVYFLERCWKKVQSAMLDVDIGFHDDCCVPARKTKGAAFVVVKLLLVILERLRTKRTRMLHVQVHFEAVRNL